jgi:hypothetical protein
MPPRLLKAVTPRETGVRFRRDRQQEFDYQGYSEILDNQCEVVFTILCFI